MPTSRDLDPAASVLAYFGAELRRLQMGAELTCLPQIRNTQKVS
jgi:hypothetical protein